MPPRRIKVNHGGLDLVGHELAQVRGDRCAGGEEQDRGAAAPTSFAARYPSGTPSAKTMSASICGKPELMKPAPYVVELGFLATDALPILCVLVGDSVTDIEAARAAGTRSIGYANRPPKIATLTAAGADVVISSMEDLLTAL